jgi:hypothetical protein
MRSAGIKELDISACSVEAFSTMFPDQKLWIEHACARGHCVQAALERLDYDGPPELFSMWCCLFSDDLMGHVLPKDIDEHFEQLQRLRHKMRVQLKQSPHPAVLLCKAGLLVTRRMPRDESHEVDDDTKC